MTDHRRAVAELFDRLGGFAFGGDYNPEQWDEATWREDVRLMQQAGVNLVSIGIFGWAVVEPSPGRMSWSVFDRVLDLLADHGIAACLATMTASPPPWLARLHPETLPVDERGVVLQPGSRQHFTPSSPVYREHAARLASAVATRYADHPALALWHVGNEYGCHLAQSYGEVDATAFRSWLAERYGSLDALNEAWSTTFWSQRYSDWAEVAPPRAAPTLRNPAQVLDFSRFSSDALLACYRMERDILRRVTPDVPITTNFMTAWKTVDYQAWADDLDVIGHDAYPDPLDPAAPAFAALNYDFMRSLGQGRPWLLMEQAPSAVSWRPVNPPKPPGTMRRWSYQAVAHGADAVMYFQWRQSRGGAEKFHSAMLPAGGADTRTHREVAVLGRELQELSEVSGSTVRAAVALVLDWSSWWALELEARPSDQLDQLELLQAHHRPLWEAGITTDVVSPRSDLSGYRVVIVPNLYLAGADVAASLLAYVRDGGHLVVSFFSGIVDDCDRFHPGAHPGAFRELLGLRITELWPLAPGQSVRVRSGDRPPFEATLWSEEIELEGAEALAEFADGALAGGPAVTRHALGTGTATYLATRPEPAALRALLLSICSDAGVQPEVADLPAQVEAVSRRDADGTRYLFLLNHGSAQVDVALPQPGTDLLTGHAHTGALALPAGEVALVRLPAG